MTAPIPLHEIRPCQGCGTPIFFILTRKGKRMPVEGVELTIVTRTGDTVKGYRPHWATCPKAKEFKP